MSEPAPRFPCPTGQHHAHPGLTCAEYEQWRADILAAITQGPAMTTPPRPPRVALTARMWQILRRCYRGQQPTLVLSRALDLLADADGHLHPDGSLKQGRRP